MLDVENQYSHVPIIGLFVIFTTLNLFVGPQQVFSGTTVQIISTPKSGTTKTPTAQSPGNLPDLPGAPGGFDAVPDVSEFARQMDEFARQKIIDMRQNEKKWQHEAFRNQDEYSQLQKELEDLKEDYINMKSRYETALAMSDVLQDCENPDEIRAHIETLVMDNQKLRDDVAHLEHELDTVSNTSSPSNFTCFGEESNYPLCMLHNVCQDGYGKWVMYGLDFNIKSFINFNLVSDENCNNSLSRQQFKFTSYLPGSDSSFQPGVTILHRPYYDQNFGHVLGDDIWAIWQALYFFNHREQSVVLHDGDITLPSTKLYDLLNVTLKSYDKTSIECYENVIMGWTQLGYALQPVAEEAQNCETGVRGERPKWQGEFKTMIRAFREHSYKILDINRSNPRSQVTILVKSKNDCEHCIYWENVDECVDALKSDFPDTRFENVSWVGMPMKDQVQIMHDTEFLIGLPGSNLMNAIWLTNATGILYVNREPDPYFFGNEYKHWFEGMDREKDGWIDNILLGSEHVQNLKFGNLTINCDAVARVLQGFREKKASTSKEA